MNFRVAHRVVKDAAGAESESGAETPRSKTLPRLSVGPNLRELLECGDLPALSIWQRDNLFNSSARQRNGALRTAPPYQF
jgi:hypothetical protein